MITGSYSGATSSFGTTTLTNAASQGYDQTFVAKLWDAGSSTGFEWAKQVGNTGNTQALNGAINGSSMYIAGYFYGTASLATTTLISAGDSDGFVVKLFDAGNTGSFAWARRVGGAGSDVVNAMAVRGASICITGSFNVLANLGLTTSTSVGSNDVFVAKIMDAASEVLSRPPHCHGLHRFSSARWIVLFLPKSGVIIPARLSSTVRPFKARTILT